MNPIGNTNVPGRRDTARMPLSGTNPSRVELVWVSDGRVAGTGPTTISLDRASSIRRIAARSPWNGKPRCSPSRSHMTSSAKPGITPSPRSTVMGAWCRLARQNRQQHRAQNVPLRPRVRARVARCSGQSASASKRPLTFRYSAKNGRWPSGITAERVHPYGLSGNVPHHASTLTRRVTLSGLSKSAHRRSLQGLQRIQTTINCRLWI